MHDQDYDDNYNQHKQQQNQERRELHLKIYNLMQLEDHEHMIL